MNFSAPFIARPVATALLMAALALLGIAAFPLLPVAPLKTWHEFKTQKVAERKRNFALAVGINIVLLHRHIRAVTKNTFDHGRNFR